MTRVLFHLFWTKNLLLYNLAEKDMRMHFGPSEEHQQDNQRENAARPPHIVVAHSLQSHGTALRYAGRNGRRDHFWSQLYSFCRGSLVQHVACFVWH